MEKHTFETYEFLSTTNTDSDTNQFFVLQDDGTILSVNKEIQYVTQVEDDKNAVINLNFTEECATVFDDPSQQYYVDVKGSASEMVSINDQFTITDGENNVYANSYLIQPESTSSTQQDETETVIDPQKLDAQQLQLLNIETFNETKQTNTLTEITLTDEQYQILQHKGWLLLESNDKIFVLNTLGLHDITTNEKLIKKLKNELHDSTDTNTDIENLKVESITTDLPNENADDLVQAEKDIVEYHIAKTVPLQIEEPRENVQILNDENVDQEMIEPANPAEKKDLPEVPMSISNFLNNGEETNSDTQKKCDSIKIKTRYTFSVPRKVREAIEINRVPNFNRDRGWTLAAAWKPILNTTSTQKLLGSLECDTVSSVCDGTFESGTMDSDMEPPPPAGRRSRRAPEQQLSPSPPPAPQRSRRAERAAARSGRRDLAARKLPEEEHRTCSKPRSRDSTNYGDNRLQVPEFRDSSPIFLPLDIPDKIFLGKAINGKNIFAKVTKLKKNGKEKKSKSQEVIYGKKIERKPLHYSTSLDVAWFTNLIQDSFRHISKENPKTIATATTVVSQLLRLPNIKNSIVGNNLVVTKVITTETDNGKEIGQPTMVTGTVRTQDGEETFIHIPLMLHQLLDKADDDSKTTEDPLTYCPEEKTAKEVIDLFHIHVSETRFTDKAPQTSINLSKRKLALDVLSDAKKRHPNPIYACGSCGTVFKSESLLKAHQNNQCIEIEDELTIDTDELNGSETLYSIIDNGNEKFYSCNICKTKFTRLFNCQKHIKAHKAGIERKLKVYKCKMCPNNYFHSSSLSKHIVKMHLQL